MRTILSNVIFEQIPGTNYDQMETMGIDFCWAKVTYPPFIYLFAVILTDYRKTRERTSPNWQGLLISNKLTWQW